MSRITKDSSLLCCRSEAPRLARRAEQTTLSLSVARQSIQTTCKRSSAAVLLHVDEVCTPNPLPLRLASSSCVLQDAGHAQNGRPPSHRACRSGTRTCRSAQQQYSSDQQFSSGPHSSSHQPHGSDQHTSTDQQQGPDISLLSPVLQRQWDHARNAHLGNMLIKPHTARKVWWRCDQCPDGHPHVWEVAVSNRSNGTTCHFCTNKRVCQHNSLATKHPDITAEFSDRNQGTAHDYTAGSDKAAFWRCKHGHEYTASFNSRTTNNSGCPECFASRRSSQPRQKHPVLTDSPSPVMQFWDSEMNSKEGLNPRKITCRSGKVCNWICHSCPKGQPHRWQAAAYRVCLGSGCPCCSGRKACICNSLQSLFPNTAAEWDYTRNTGTPDECPAHSHKRVWWCTPKRGSFQARIIDRTRVLQPHTTK